MQFAATLPATDMERVRAWHTSVMQLEPIEVTEQGDAWYEVGGSRFLVYASQFAGTNQATAAAFGVEDVDASIAELKARGAVFEDYDFGDDFRTVDGIMTMPDGTRLGWFEDSEGNILNIGPARDMG
jgi:predicted enzyme related to lactoylglutathione lyase